jgi:hypothetical protein
VATPVVSCTIMCVCRLVCLVCVVCRVCRCVSWECTANDAVLARGQDLVGVHLDPVDEALVEAHHRRSGHAHEKPVLCEDLRITQPGHRVRLSPTIWRVRVVRSRVSCGRVSCGRVCRAVVSCVCTFVRCLRAGR